MTLSTIKVAVVDDQPLLVSAFSALVGAQPDMEVVLEAVTGREAVDRLSARAGAPQGSTDLVLMDLRMPVLDGISAIRELRAAPATASLRVLVLTTFDDEDLVLAAGLGWTRPSPVPFWRTLMQVPDRMLRSHRLRRRDRLTAPCPLWGHRRAPTSP